MCVDVPAVRCDLQLQLLRSARDSRLIIFEGSRRRAPLLRLLFFFASSFFTVPALLGICVRSLMLMN